jgi:hypothetical protein
MGFLQASELVFRAAFTEIAHLATELLAFERQQEVTETQQLCLVLCRTGCA